jgi:hypothetical protein
MVRNRFLLLLAAIRDTLHVTSEIAQRTETLSRQRPGWPSREELIEQLASPSADILFAEIEYRTAKMPAGLLPTRILPAPTKILPVPRF